MKASFTSMLRAGVSAGIAGLLCFTSPAAAADPKPRRTPEEVAKEMKEVQRRVEALRKELEELEARKGDRAKPLPLAPALVPKNTDVRLGTQTIESGTYTYKRVRDSIYEADRHGAEKIKARVREADAKAKVLLEGGAPSHVLGR
jgi:hypothetical protein